MFTGLKGPGKICQGLALMDYLETELTFAEFQLLLRRPQDW